MPTRVLLPRRIYDARLRAGKTQDDVAYELRQRGLKSNARQVRRWEAGTHAPRAEVIPIIADVLGVQIDDLYGSTDEEEDEDPVARLRRIRAELVLAGRDDLAADLLKFASGKELQSS